MQRYKTFTLFFISFFLSTNNYAISSSQFNGTWKGVEVMGCNLTTSNEIRNIINLKVGSKFEQSAEELESWCKKIKKNTNENIECDIIGFQTGDFYYNVQVIPKNQKRYKYRKISNKSKVKLPNDIEKLHDQWHHQRMLCFEKSSDPKESFKKGYLDYENNEQLHNTSIKLKKLSTQYNDILIQIILTESDPKIRAKAAILLSWSTNNQDIKKVISFNLLDDPNETVRNNLVRALSSRIAKLEDENLLSQFVAYFCRQISMPSHTDRNKGLTSLVKIFEEHPTLKLPISYECKNEIQNIAETSILPNVGDEANKLLKIIHSPKNA